MAADDVQFDVDDTSPTISYSPFRDSLDTPNLLEGWNPYYTDSGFSPAPGETGKGTSLHITSRNNAQLSITWRGAAPFHTSLRVELISLQAPALNYRAT